MTETARIKSSPQNWCIRNIIISGLTGIQKRKRIFETFYNLVKLFTVQNWLELVPQLPRDIVWKQTPKIGLKWMSPKSNPFKTYRQRWKELQKTDRRRLALEDDNNDGNEGDKGRTEATENGNRETAASRARLGSFHCPLSGIRLPLNCCRIFSGEE